MQQINWKAVGLSIALFVGGYAFSTAEIGGPLAMHLFYGYMCAGIPSGWMTLSAITPQVFLFMPFGSWMTYFLIKGFLSIFVGLVALPVRIIRAILLLFF